MIGGSTAQRFERAGGPLAPRRRPLAQRLPDPGAALAGAPDRYRILESDGLRTLVCSEAPGVTVRVQQGVTWTAAAARRAPPGSIFLDGAASGGPFLDPQRGVYNLDHHDGCVRAFTLATCEQAMVLVRRIVDLRRRDWTIYANDADLDTVLAIWVLFNHLRLNADDGRARRAVMPLLRLESVIDAHGLGHLELCGAVGEPLHTAWSWMQELRRRELAIKKQGRWRGADLLAFLADRLRAIDALVYPPGTFEDLLEIEELARTRIGGGSVAVACRASEGIYEVERQLRRVHGDRLGLIVLRTDASTYSIRQVDPELPASLDDAYALLNRADPSAGGSGSSNRWGGSSEIGGSPRRSGTRLRPDEVLGICRRVYHPHPVLARSAGLLQTLAAGAVLLGAALLAAGAAAGRAALPLAGPAAFGASLCLGALAASLLAGRRGRGLSGLRRAELLGSWRWVPLAALGAAAGGVWGTPLAEASGPGLAAAAALAASAELLFRGLVQGRLAWALGPRRRGWSGLVSSPVLGASLLYTATLLLAPLAAGSTLLLAPLAADSTLLLTPLAVGSPIALPAEVPRLAVTAAGALCFGLASGSLRERTGSVLPCIGLHVAAAWLLLGIQLAA
jgi:hypothetical protein